MAATVPGCPKCMLTIEPGPTASSVRCATAVGARIGVVEGVDVEAEHGAVPAWPATSSTTSGSWAVPSSVPDGRKNWPGEPESRVEHVAAAHDLVEHRIARQREERRVRVRVVRELVAGVGDLLRPRGIGVEPVADDERRHHHIVRGEDVEQLLRKVEVAVRVERRARHGRGCAGRCRRTWRAASRSWSWCQEERVVVGGAVVGGGASSSSSSPACRLRRPSTRSPPGPRQRRPPR